MKQLNISPELALPVGIANKTICIFGKGGSGKSNLEVVLAEELYSAGIPTCIIDPADIHYGIKSARDGKSAGLPFIVFGGLHADVPIYPENGALLADLFLDRGLYMVIVTQPWTGGERTRFMTDFANQLYKRGPEKEQRGSARVLILEEAHEYVPLNPGKGEEVMLGAMKRLYTVGRNYWIGFIAATRRPAKMHTDLRNGADITAFFQIVGTQDRDAMQKYLGENAPEDIRKEILTHLAKLPVGTAYFYQPDQDPALQRLKFRYRDTLDTTTTEITAGHKVIKPVLAEVDLTKLGDAMAAAREKAKADDPRELRKKLAEQQRLIESLNQRFKDTKPQVEVREVEKQVVDVDFLRALPAQVRSSLLSDIGGTLRILEEHIEAHIGRLQGQVAKPAARAGAGVERITSPPPAERARPVPPAGRHTHVHGPVAPAAPNGHSDKGTDFIGEKVTGQKQRILDTLAMLEDVGIAPANRPQLAAFVNLRHTSGGFKNYLGSLKSAGLIDYPNDGHVSLTDGGRSLASPPAVATTSEQLQERFKQLVSPQQRRILDFLIAAWPQPVSRQDLADAINLSVTSGGFKNYLGEMRTLRFISYPADGFVAAESVLFLEEARR